MATRICLTSGCPNRVQAGDVGTRAGRCVSCSRQLDRARGTRQARGYDAAYDRARRDYAVRMANGERFLCWRCPELGRPAHYVDPDAWHLGHDTTDRTVLRGPQCEASNLATCAAPTAAGRAGDVDTPPRGDTPHPYP